MAMGGVFRVCLTLWLSINIATSQHHREMVDESVWDCDFDTNSFCFFDTDGGFEVRSGSTQISRTGPTEDYSGSGYYVYTKAWTNYLNAASNGGFKLQLDFGYAFTGIGVSFYYHMYGVNMGTLRLRSSTDGSTFTTVWEQSGDRGINATWEYAYVSLATNPVSIMFMQVSALGNRADGAYDEIKFISAPTPLPSMVPAPLPTPQPSLRPSSQPTVIPTPLPTAEPYLAPSQQPTGVPTILPSIQPTARPSIIPSPAPSAVPLLPPTGLPTLKPSPPPTVFPSLEPTPDPTHTPTSLPTSKPSLVPTSLETVAIAMTYELQSTASVTDADVEIVRAAMETSFQDSSFGSYSVRNMVITDQVRRLRETNQRARSLATVVWDVSCDVNVDITTTTASNVVELQSLVVDSLNSLTFVEELGTITFDNTTVITIAETRKPTAQPNFNPTPLPTKRPTFEPTFSPTRQPTHLPTEQPSAEPLPSPHPTQLPTPRPSVSSGDKGGFSVLTLSATMSIVFIGGIIFLCAAAGGAWLYTHREKKIIKEMELKQFTMMSNMNSINTANQTLSSAAYMDPMTGMMVDPMMTGMTMTGMTPMTMTGNGFMIDPMTGMMMNNNSMMNSMMGNGMMMNNNMMNNNNSMMNSMMGNGMMNNNMMGNNMMGDANVVPDENGMIPGMVPGYVPDMNGSMVPGMVPGLVPAPPEMLAQMNRRDDRVSGDARASGEGVARTSREAPTRQSGEDANKPKKSIASLEDTMKAFEKNLNDEGLSAPKSAEKQLLRKPSAAAKKDSFSASAASKRVYHIPRYAVMLEDKPFAHGGGGQIFKGMYMGNEIAAKQVYDSKSGQAHSVDFDNEVAVLTKLSHPCVLSCFGVTADEDGSMYQVLEMCTGGDLCDYYKTNAFTTDEFCRIFLEFLSGITYIHERDISHRDLKPENVLLSDPVSRKVKIADFGLALQKEDQVTRGVGTPVYMSPEMFNDDGKAVDGKAVDVFAVGIIMWELWFRTMPWAGKSIHAILADSVRGVRPPLEGPPTSPKPKTPIKKKKGDLPPLGPPPPAPLAMKKLMTKCWAQEATARPHLPEIYITFQNEVVPAIEAITHKKISSTPKAVLTPTEAKRRGLVKSKSKSTDKETGESTTAKKIATASTSRPRSSSKPTSPPTSPKVSVKRTPSKKPSLTDKDKLLGTAL